MLWELSAEDRQALLYTCPQLRQAMRDGYDSHLAAQAANRARDNWYALVIQENRRWMSIAHATSYVTAVCDNQECWLLITRDQAFNSNVQSMETDIVSGIPYTPEVLAWMRRRIINWSMPIQLHRADAINDLSPESCHN